MPNSKEIRLADKGPIHLGFEVIIYVCSSQNYAGDPPQTIIQNVLSSMVRIKRSYSYLRKVV